MIKILDEVKMKNPYPEDIYTEPTPDEYIQVQKLFKDVGLNQDKTPRFFIFILVNFIIIFSGM